MQITLDIPDAILALMRHDGAETPDAQAALLKQRLVEYLEDLYWGERADEAKAEGYVSEEEGEAWLQEMRNAGN